jgi:hypothetical protein
VHTHCLNGCAPGETVETALHFLRVLCQGSRQALGAVEACGLLRVSQGYLALQGQWEGARVEALRLWRVALAYGADLEALTDVMALMGRPEAGGVGEPHRVCAGVFVRWGRPAIRALYRALEQACFAAAALGARLAHAKGREGEEDFAAQHAILAQCRARLDAVSDEVLTAGEGEGGQAALVDSSAQLHFLAGYVGAGLADGRGENFVSRVLSLLLSSVINRRAAAVESLIVAAAEAKRGCLQPTMPPQASTQTSATVVDALLGLVRLATLMLPRAPAGEAQTLIVAFLTTVLERLRCEGAWAEWARGGHRARGSFMDSLFVRLESAILLALADLGSQRLAPELRDHAMMLVPLCGPGSEAVVRRLMEEVALAPEPLLQQIFTSVACGAGTGGLERSASLLFPQPLKRSSLLLAPSNPSHKSELPLPCHWLLFPLLCHGEGGDALRFLQSCLRLLQALEGSSRYLALLPPALKLANLMCICQYKASLLADAQVSAAFAALSRKWLAAIPPQQLPAELEGALATLESRRQGGEQGRLTTFVGDLLERFQEDSCGVGPFAWTIRLFLRQSFPPEVRATVWTELGRAGILHLLDEGEAADEDMGPYTDAADRQPTLLDLYVEALTTQRSPFGLERGAFPALVAIRHLSAHILDAQKVWLHSARLLDALVLTRAACMAVSTREGPDLLAGLSACLHPVECAAPDTRGPPPVWGYRPTAEALQPRRGPIAGQIGGRGPHEWIAESERAGTGGCPRGLVSR